MVKKYDQICNTGNGNFFLVYNRFKQTVILTANSNVSVFGDGELTGVFICTCPRRAKHLSLEGYFVAKIEKEIGFHVKDIRGILKINATHDYSNGFVSLYLAEYHDEIVQYKDQDKEIVELHYQTAYNMIFTGEIKDAKTIILLQHFMRYYH